MARDEPRQLHQQDPQGMRDLILRLPQMCDEAWQLATKATLPRMAPKVIVTLGMGGSGIGGDLLRAVLYDEAPIPTISVKDYRIPASVGRDTLVFACSYSGNTEETLAGYDEALQRGAACVAITSGGELLRRAREREHVTIVIPGGLPPRAALPYLFLPMLGLLARLGVVASYDAQLSEAVQILRQIGAEQGSGPAGLARGLGESLLHRIPVIYSASPFLEPVAQRWKDQMNENAKTFAVWNTFPELNHNETVGWGVDDVLAKTLAVVLLRDRHETIQLTRRVTITRELAFQKAGSVQEVSTTGEGKLARLLSLIMVGDLASWHLATLRGVDPTPVPVIEELKRRLAKSG